MTKPQDFKIYFTESFFSELKKKIAGGGRGGHQPHCQTTGRLALQSMLCARYWHILSVITIGEAESGNLTAILSIFVI